MRLHQKINYFLAPPSNWTGLSPEYPSNWTGASAAELLGVDFSYFWAYDDISFDARISQTASFIQYKPGGSLLYNTHYTRKYFLLVSPSVKMMFVITKKHASVCSVHLDRSGEQ